MSDVTRILSQIESGDSSAAETLLPLIYDELRRLAAARMAREKAGHMLQPTALVHEAWLRLVDQPDAPCWNGRAHFFAAAAEAMRRILVDAARRRQAVKRGGGAERVAIEPDLLAARVDSPYLLEVHDLLEALREVHADAAEVVKLRYFGGLSVAETATVLGISPRSVDRLWAYARAWLFARLQPSGDSM
jgi:RNA polymerase sigma factor (TIGR02999 family)